MTTVLIGAVLGGAAGFGWYSLVGCTTGACPLTSNPYVSVAYGMILGVLAASTL